MPRPATGVTPVRNVRIPDHIWNAAKATAEQRGETLTSVIEAALRRYIARHKTSEDASKPVNDAHL